MVPLEKLPISEQKQTKKGIQMKLNVNKYKLNINKHNILKSIK